MDRNKRTVRGRTLYSSVYIYTTSCIIFRFVLQVVRFPLFSCSKFDTWSIWYFLSRNHKTNNVHLFFDRTAWMQVTFIVLIVVQILFCSIHTCMYFYYIATWYISVRQRTCERMFRETANVLRLFFCYVFFFFLSSMLLVSVSVSS